ncbi:helix-turn-helix domain-containing protein [Endozoicomonas sp.]|uniref:helix-turn-helix domain-containing protein n=1 Tax=Endozoicomonas sp. TaxID=1892382 RepID=UPI003AF58F90
MEYLDVVFSFAPRELKVSEFDKEFAVKHNVCAGTLQQKRLDLIKRVKEGVSCDELSNQFGLDKQAIAKWVKVINADYKVADLETGYLQRKLFTALWSDALVKNRSEIVAEIFDSEFRLGKAHKWCNAFTKMLLTEKHDKDIQRKYGLNQDQIDIFRKNVKKQQSKIKSGESVPKRKTVKRKDCYSVEHPVRKKKKLPSTIAHTEPASGSDTHRHTHIKIEPTAIEEKTQTAVQPVKKERVPVFELFGDFSFPDVVSAAEEPLSVNKIEPADGCETGSDAESLSSRTVNQGFRLVSPFPVIMTAGVSSELIKPLGALSI